MEKKSIDTYFQLSMVTIVVIKILEFNQNTVLSKEILGQFLVYGNVLNGIKLIRNQSEDPFDNLGPI